MPELTIGSLCSGIGGLDMAAELAGLGRVVWQVEKEPACQQILRRHWPDVRLYDDVKLTDWESVEPVDVILAGYPCQPFSLAGQRKGNDDPRHLWPAVLDAIRILRPRVAILENVSAHLSLGFDTVLGDLASLGFDADWTSVRAAEVGAPHRRERIFVAAFPAHADDGEEPDGPEHEQEVPRLLVSGHGGGPAPADAELAREHADGRVRGGVQGSGDRPRGEALPSGPEVAQPADAQPHRSDAHPDADSSGLEVEREPEPRRLEGPRRSEPDGLGDDGRLDHPSAAAPPDASGSGRDGREAAQGGEHHADGHEGGRDEGTGLAEGRPQPAPHSSSHEGRLCDGDCPAAADAECLGRGPGAGLCESGARGLGRGRPGDDNGQAPADADVQGPQGRSDASLGGRADDEPGAGREQRPGQRGDVAWGPFLPAIERWERVVGRAAPAPTTPANQLSPVFVCWMMGFPEGWVDGLSRTQALKALGNAVVPLHGAAAIVELLG